MLTLWHLNEVLRDHQYGRMHDVEVQEELRNCFKKLRNSNTCASLLKKHLTKKIFNQCRYRKTFSDYNLLDIIRSGVRYMDSRVGVHVPDPACYTIFSDFLVPLVHELHGTGPDIDQPPIEFGHMNAFPSMDAGRKSVLSLCIRCVRNLSGYPIGALQRDSHYLRVERLLADAFSELEGDLKGTYCSLVNMDPATQKRLVAGGYLFTAEDPYLEASGTYRYWPKGRGLFFNDAMTLYAWVGEEDHLRLFSRSEGGNLKGTYRRFVLAVRALEEKLKFERDRHFGLLTFSPHNIGCAVKASARMRLRCGQSALDEVGKELDLIVTRCEEDERETKKARKFIQKMRQQSGEEGDPAQIYEVSVRGKHGDTEYETVRYLQNAVVRLLAAEAEERRAKKSGKVGAQDQSSNIPST